MSNKDTEPSPLDISRRGFLKGVGAGAVATGLVQPVAGKKVAEAATKVVGPEGVSITRNVNGACTVLVDGDPIYSCSMLAVEAEGAEITTVEGLGTPDDMSDVQEAFVEHDASQCGFCTPGFVVATTAFVRDNPGASLDEARLGMGGNLCRCGTHTRIIRAIKTAAKNL